MIEKRFFITLALLIVGGLIAAAGMIVAKKPNAKDLIDKLTPHQGYIGIGLLLFGIWELISVIRHMSVLKFIFKLPFKVKFFFIMDIVAIPVAIILGVLLGYGLLSKYVVKGEDAQAKGEALRAKLQTFAGPLGLVSIATGVLWLVAYLMFPFK